MMVLAPLAGLVPALVTACAGVQVAGGSAPVSGGSAPAAPVEASPGEATLDEAVEGLTPLPGFVPLWWDGDGGRLLAEPPLGVDLLYATSLPGGLGSNRIGLDRGGLGSRHLVRFERVGPRILLLAPNLDWTSSAESPAERAAVRDSFATSVLHGFAIEARGDGRFLVDLTDFVVRDAGGAARAIRSAGQGSYSFDAERSGVWPDATRGFPDNTEVEVLLTLAGDDPGPEVRATTPDPRSVTLRLRHSFVRLPDLESSAYRPRAYDPRSGFIPRTWKDLSAPVDAPLQHQVLRRHHLSAEEPIVYYVDSGAPEPVRTALVEGALYWAPMFEAAGFPGGFRVEVLPEGADPQDVRYNVIQWVHRSTRGWSYGDSLVDPRTGQILKGHVTLGALRVRQDVLLAEGLLSPYGDEAGTSDARVLGMALDRLRQLSAHEVGHTLGLVHNFAASTQDRASVMDYPAPRVRIAEDGSLDLSDAYRDGCGPWDEMVIRYGYAAFEDEEAGLAETLAEMDRRGLVFLTDADARGADRAHPLANLWDDGADPVEGLLHEIEVRRAALDRFGAGAIEVGEPLSRLEEVLVPLYFHHRFQLEAAVRQIGGVDYRHAVRGAEGEEDVVRPVDVDVQEQAFNVVRLTLTPAFLDLPDGLWASIPPPAPGADGAAERFAEGALPLDEPGIRAAAIHMTLDLLLDPVRAARLVDQHAADPDLLGLDDVLARLRGDAWRPADPEGGVRGELRAQLLERFLFLASDPGVPLRVQRSALGAVGDLRRWLDATPGLRDTEESARQVDWERRLLDHFFADPLARAPRPRTPELPPGSPIGEWQACGFAAHPW